VSGPRHFLDLDQIEGATLRSILDRAVAFKRERSAGERTGAPHSRRLAGKVVAMLFERPSTRTRLSFAVAMHELGGASIVVRPEELQLFRGESIADTARVLSRYVDGIVLRTVRASTLTELARHASIPVINGLTGRTHPCQLMADIMTFEEARGPIAGRVVAWSGDGNNMANTWIHAAARFGFSLRMACPPALPPAAECLVWARGQGADIALTADPAAAVRGADCVVTDAWVSMGQEGEVGARHELLAPYRVDERLMALAKPDALFMHCLPAHRGEEVSAAVIDGPRAVVWDEAENRLHAQKGILVWCLG